MWRSEIPVRSQNPLVVGVDHLLEILIGQHAGRYVASERADFRCGQIISPEISYAEDYMLCYIRNEWKWSMADAGDEIFAAGSFVEMRPRTPVPAVRSALPPLRQRQRAGPLAGRDAGSEAGRHAGGRAG